MTGPTPAIAVTLPATNVEEARREVETAARAGADLAEIRFDRWSRAAFADRARLFPSDLPLIATLRSQTEGGQGPGDPRSRSERLLELARLPFRWIDLEWDRDLELFAELPAPSQLGRILSTHFPNGVRPDVWARRLRDPVPSGCVRKVVAWSRIGPLLTELLPQLPPPGSGSVIALTVGPSGPLLRAWARRLGFPIVFAALPSPSFAVPEQPAVEPSQIPVDHLRPFLSAEDHAPMFGLAGHPVGHTWSPALHARWMARLHQPGIYVPLDFETEPEFVDALDVLAEWGFRGVNVTHPWKTAALEAATEVSGGAAICGVANTLTFRGDSIEAENTDLIAALRRLEELKRQGRWDGSSLAVVGSGGAARATLAAARTLGARARVYARRPLAAEDVAATFGAEAREVGDAEREPLVVHATTVGRPEAGPLEVPIVDLLGPGVHVLDWVYGPEVPEIRSAALRAGATYEDGRRLLVYQAAASFGLWWGEEPSPEAIDESLREVGCEA